MPAVLSRPARALYALAGVCFAAFFSLAVLLSVVYSRIPFYAVHPAVLAGFAVLAAGVLWLGRTLFLRLPALSPRMEWAIGGGALAVWWCVQLAAAWCLEVRPTETWDFGVVFSAARTLAEGSRVTGDYFTLFPNNIPLCLVLAAFMRVFGTGMLPALVLNTLAVNLSVLFAWRTLRRLAGQAAGLCGLGVCLCLAPLVLYGPIVYTDTLSMPFVCGAARLWAWAREGGARRRLAGLVLAGAVCAAGAWLKMTAAILLAAVVLDAVLGLPGRQKLLAAGAAAAFALVYLPLSLLAANSVLAGDPDAAVPHSHWVMMGLSGDGGYNDDDYQLTLASAPDKAGRDAFARGEILRRVEEMGPAGLAQHLAAKLSYTWGDGTCYAPMKLDIAPVRATPLQGYCIQGLPHTGRTVYVSTGLQLALLGFAVWGAVRGIRRRDYRPAFVQMAVLGLGLFLLVWEARSRYIVSFLPLAALCGVWGLWPASRPKAGL